MADKFTFRGVGEIQEVEFALARNEWTHQLLTKATGGEFFGLVKEVLEGRAEICRIEQLGSVISEKQILTIDRSKPFDPLEFLGRGWTIWRGPADGNGLEGDEEQNARSLAITKIDLSKIQLVTTLRAGENTVKGEENLRRLREANHTCLDAGIFQTFWNQQELIPQLLKELTNGGITYVFFKGTTLRTPHGSRCVLGFYFRGGGWDWVFRWLGHDWSVYDPSVVLAS